MTLPRLVSTEELDFSVLAKIAPEGIYYDKRVDTLVLYFSEKTDKENCVHYLEGDIALIFEIDSKMVLGLHIENFEQIFLKQTPLFELLWRQYWKLFFPD